MELEITAMLEQKDLTATKQDVELWEAWFRKVAKVLEFLHLNALAVRFFFAAGACAFINSTAVLTALNPATDAAHNPNLTAKVRNVSGNRPKRPYNRKPKSPRAK
jgi:hypothetical protein